MGMWRIIFLCAYCLTIYTFFYLLIVLDIDLHSLNSVVVYLSAYIFLLPVLWGFLFVGAKVDTYRLSKKLKKNEMVLITHRGTRKSITEKLYKNTIPAHDVFLKTGIQKSFGKWFMRKMDHKSPAVWVHLGKPSKVPELLLGLNSKDKYNFALTFELPMKDLDFPSGFIKRLFAGYQCVIEKDITIPRDSVLYSKGCNGQWVEVKKTDL